MRVYYDLILWEEVDENDTDKLKTKFAEMGKRFGGYGVLEFKMRAAPTGQPPGEIDIPQQQPEAQGEELAEGEEVEYVDEKGNPVAVDEKGNPVTQTENDTIVEE